MVRFALTTVRSLVLVTVLALPSQELSGPSVKSLTRQLRGRYKNHPRG